MKTLETNSVDSIVTDPPYGLSFMGKHWDIDVPKVEIWQEAIRVLKPGGHIISFGGTRTYHRMAVAIEDAGFEIRDMVSWVYGQGFPKSLNLYKQVQKMCTCGNMEAYDLERTKQEAKHGVRPLSDSNLSQEVSAGQTTGEVLQSRMSEQSTHGTMQGKEPKESVEDGKEPSLERGSNLQEGEGELQWSEVRSVSEGVSADGEKGRIHIGTSSSNGTILGDDADTNAGCSSRQSQPERQSDREPCAFCKQYGTQKVRRRAGELFGFGTSLKPSAEPCVLARKPLSEKTVAENVLKWGTGGLNIDGCRVGTESTRRTAGVTPSIRTAYGSYAADKGEGRVEYGSAQGRFPANLIHDGSPEVLSLFPESTSGARKAGFSNKDKGYKASSYEMSVQWDKDVPAEKGSAARFFYCAKSSKAERNRGCEGLEDKITQGMRANAGPAFVGNDRKRTTLRNHHPTVKPIALMEYLIKLVTPKGGTVLDPFMGSGTTGIAAKRLGHSFIGIELDEQYFNIAKARIEGTQTPLI